MRYRWHKDCFVYIQEIQKIKKYRLESKMTEKEAIDIIKDSTLWNQLSNMEKAEAIGYAIDIAKRNIKNDLSMLKEQPGSI